MTYIGHELRTFQKENHIVWLMLDDLSSKITFYPIKVFLSFSDIVAIQLLVQFPLTAGRCSWNWSQKIILTIFRLLLDSVLIMKMSDLLFLVLVSRQIIHILWPVIFKRNKYNRFKKIKFDEIHFVLHLLFWHHKKKFNIRSPSIRSLLLWQELSVHNSSLQFAIFTKRWYLESELSSKNKEIIKVQCYSIILFLLRLIYIAFEISLNKLKFIYP